MHSPRPVPQVMVSSTFTDLAAHRDALIQAIHQHKMHANVMEHDAAKPAGDVIESSLRMVRESAGYICVISKKYGQTPECPTRNPHGLSITELEFNEALRLQRPILLFIMGNQHYALEEDFEQDQEKKRKLNAFRERAKKLPNSTVDRVYSIFNSLDEFKNRFASSLAEMRNELDAIPPQPAAVLQAPKPQPPVIKPPPPDFTGRDKELERLIDHVNKGGRVIGIRGMGGMGKSSLALKLAESLAPQFADGQIYIELKGTDPQPMSVPDAMRRVIRIIHGLEYKTPDDVNELQGLYHATLAGKRVLLLLDNAVDAGQVSPLLPGKDSLVVFTSRQRFHVPGMLACELAELSPEAARSFLLNACPDVVDLPQFVDEIARRLWYLPFVLRLAVPAIDRPEGAEEYVRQLRESNPTNLAEGVDAVIALSHNLLDEVHKQRMAMLAVFKEGFTAKICKHVWDVTSAEADRTIKVLFDHNLLLWNPTRRQYHFHDLVRDFVEISSRPTQLAVASQRHAAAFGQVVEELNRMYHRGGNHQLEALEQFDRDRSNLISGFEWARAHYAESDVAARLCNQYALDAWYLLEMRREPRFEWAAAGLQAARQLDDQKSIAVNSRRLAWQYINNDPPEALRLYNEALSISRALQDRKGEAIVLRGIAVTYLENHEIDLAIENCVQSLAISREPGVADRRAEINALSTLGAAYDAKKDLPRAIEYYEMSVTLAKKLDDLDGELRDLYHLARLNLQQFQLPKAVACYERAMELQRVLHRGKGHEWILNQLTHIATFMSPPPEKSPGWCRQLLDVAIQLQRCDIAKLALERMIACSRKRGDNDSPVEAAGMEVCQLLDKIGDLPARLAELSKLGLSLYHQKIPRPAEACFDRAKHLARQLGDRRAEGNALGNLGCVLTDLERWEEAIAAHEQAIAIDRQLNDRNGEAQGCWDLGETYERRGDFTRAAELMQIRVDYCRELGHPNTNQLQRRIDQLGKKPGSAQ